MVRPLSMAALAGVLLVSALRPAGARPATDVSGVTIDVRTGSAEAPAPGIDDLAAALQRLGHAWDGAVLDWTRRALRALEDRAVWEYRTSPAGLLVDALGGGVHRLVELVLPGEGRRFGPRHALRVLSVRPAAGELSSRFGWRRDPFRRGRRFHRGIDINADRGAPVRAAGPGIVVRAGWVRGYGRTVVVDHGLGLESRYAHLRRIRVSDGDFVPAGALVGRVGASGRATGPHLHFEVRRDGRAMDPELAFEPLPELAPLEVRIARWMVPGPDAGR